MEEEEEGWPAGRTRRAGRPGQIGRRCLNVTDVPARAETAVKKRGGYAGAASQAAGTEGKG